MNKETVAEMTSASDTQTATSAEGKRESNSMVKPVAMLAVGLVMLIVAFANLSRIPGWADDHGAIWVYLGFFAFMSIAGRLFWNGADELVKRMRG
ncbi:hypothetical protein JK358_38550 [Nocardia sp. 2]|uniref:Uncharacterized protein n=1 Tax=Nocardia acididurans TaxID=2802282 RepID=A0ABS1MI22_9NOCA|nr:hypothetical protein [Nocardia acididurans]MBL1080313.1 hypothetical protein [Nocardia acididurans]